MKSEIKMMEAKAEIHEKIVGVATNRNLTRMELLRILQETQTWMLEIASRDFDGLTAWKEEAMEVMAGIQDIGRALDLRPGTQITGVAALEAIEKLKSERKS